MKTIKIIISILALMVILSTVVVATTPVYAGTKIDFVPSTTIPGSEFKAGTLVKISSDSLGEYIIAIYNYGVGLVSVLAVVMIMLGGYKWIFAAGNASKIGEAKSTIISALVGLILALGSFLLLNAINPELTKFKPLYTPPPKIASCPWHVRACSDVNSYFNYVGLENETLSATAIHDSMDYYSDKYGFEKGDYSDDRKIALQARICMNKEAELTACAIPSGVCFVDIEDASSDLPCRSIIEKSCSGKPQNYCGKFITGAFCQTKTNYCSLGVRGSVCNNNNECKDGSSCVDNKCFKLGKEGESCDKNKECEASLVCSNDDDDIITPDKCIPGSISCTLSTIESTCFAGNYILEPGLDTIGAFCRVNPNDYTQGYCDCDEDADCKPGYRCVDVKSDVVDRDVCISASYR